MQQNAAMQVEGVRCSGEIDVPSSKKKQQKIRYLGGFTVPEQNVITVCFSINNELFMVLIF